MSLRQEIQAEIAAAFSNDLADAVQSFTCSKTEQSGEFDYATQTYPVVTVASYTGRGVLFGSYSKDLVKPVDYQAEDAKATVLQNEVTGVPQIDDVWATPKGSFRVVSIKADPAGATWSIQLRKV